MPPPVRPARGRTSKKPAPPKAAKKRPAAKRSAPKAVAKASTKARAKATKPKAKSRQSAKRAPSRVRAIASRKLPRKGVSSAFRQFVTSPRKGRARQAYAIIDVEFSYDGARTLFTVPLALGPRTAAQLGRMSFADVAEQATYGNRMQKGTVLRVRGFAHLKPQAERAGLSIKKSKASRAAEMRGRKRAKKIRELQAENKKLRRKLRRGKK